MNVKQIWAIRNKETKEYHEFNRHVAWKSKGAAKLSYFAATSKWNREKGVRFDEQKTYEVVNLLEGL